MTFISITPAENIDCEAADLLDRHLAGAIDLRRQVERARRNMGAECAPIRKLLKDVAQALDGYSQRLCERARSLPPSSFGRKRASSGAGAAISAQMFATGNAEAEVASVAADLAAFGEAARCAAAKAAASSDIETCRIFTGLSHELDYDLWLLESLSAPLFARQYWPGNLPTGISIGGAGA